MNYNDPNQRPRFPPRGNMPPDQNRMQMYGQPQPQHQQYPMQRMPQPGPGGQNFEAPRHERGIPQVTPENIEMYYQKVPIPAQHKQALLARPIEEQCERMQTIINRKYAEASMQHQQMMNHPMSQQPPHQPPPQQHQQQRYLMQPQGGPDIQGGFIPEQKHQVPFPGPGPNSQQPRKPPTPPIPAPFPGPGPSAQNPSTIGGTSQAQPLHQSHSHPSFGIQASQPPPQNPPDYKFSTQVKSEFPPQQSGMPPSQPPPQQQYSMQPPHSQQSQQQMYGNQSFPPEMKFPPRPDMQPHQQQQHQMQMHQQQMDYGGPPSMPTSQPGPMMPPNQPQQQSFGIPSSQTLTQSASQPTFQQAHHQPPPFGGPQPMQEMKAPPQNQPQQPPPQMMQPGPIQPQKHVPPQSGMTAPSFGQGPSPAIPQNVINAGRAPTPKSVVSQEMLNSKEYQDLLAELQTLRDPCYRIISRIKDDPAHAVVVQGLIKSIEVIEGKKAVSYDFMKKLIKNIQMAVKRFDVAVGIRRATDIIENYLNMDLTHLVSDPYEKYRHLMISAPKAYYKEADNARNARKEDQYLNKTVKWYKENNFWDGSEPLPYPYKRAIRQYTTEGLAEVNRVYTEKMNAPISEEAIEDSKEITQLKKGKGLQVRFNAEVQCLVRVNAYSSEGESDYGDFEDDDSLPDEIVVEEEVEDETSHPSNPSIYDTSSRFPPIDEEGYAQPVYYDQYGWIQPNISQDYGEQTYAEEPTSVEQPINESSSQVNEPVVEEMPGEAAPDELDGPPAKRMKLDEPRLDANFPPQNSEEPTQDTYEQPNDYAGDYPNDYAEPQEEYISIPAPVQGFQFNTDGFEAEQTKEEQEVDEEYTAYLKRQQEASYSERQSLNSQLVQQELYANSLAMPQYNYYRAPLMSPPPHPEKPHEPPVECPYSCCTPYEIDVFIGKAAVLPQAAATELRKHRHRVDYENMSLSEHSPYYPVIINVARPASKFKYPELRVIIAKEYPQIPIDFEIVRPPSLKGKKAKAFYDKLHKKMIERKLCGIPLHTINETAAAFRYCVESVYRKRDALDFRNF